MPALLKKGSKGEAVTELQGWLYQLGYNPGSTDGIFGPKTEKAVKAFQRDTDLQVDGIVGPATRASLENAIQFTGDRR